MDKETRITFQEHINLGNCLRIAADKLTEIYCRIKPKTMARKSNEAKALKLINELRSVLDDILIKDYGLNVIKNLN